MKKYYDLLIYKIALLFEKISLNNFIIKTSNYFKENPRVDYLLLFFSVFIISIVLFNQFIFGDYLYLFNQYDPGFDSLTHHYSVMAHIYKNPEGLSWWSFNSGIGNNMFSLFLIFIGDPFMGVCAFFWSDFEDGLIYMLILQLLAISLLFYKFILLLTKHRYAALFVSLLFTFNGFIALLGVQYYFVTKIFYFILLLYAIECLLQNKTKYILYIAFVLNLMDIYFFYQGVFFIGFYLIFRSIYFSSNLKSFFIHFSKIFVIGLISLFISAVFILPYFSLLANSPRISFDGLILTDILNKSFSIQSKDFYLSMFGRFFSTNFSGNASNYFGFKDYTKPALIYSGIIIFLVLPQVFFLKNRKDKIAIIFLISVTLFTLFIPFFAFLLNNFVVLYYRWTYTIIAFNLIGVAIILKSFIIDKTLNVKLLKWTFGIIIFLFSVYLYHYKFKDGELYFTGLRGWFHAEKYTYLKPLFLRIGLFLFCYFLLLQLLNKYKFIVGSILMLLISCEVVFENYPTFNTRGRIKKNHIPYDNSSNDIIQKIKSDDKSPFYRIDKNYFSFYNSYNDAYVHQYYGLKSYNSTNHKSYYDFLIFSNCLSGLDWMNVLPHASPNFKRYKIMDLLSVKYLLSKKEVNDTNFLLLNKYKNINIYKNKKMKSFGSLYTKSILLKNILKYSTLERDSILCSRLLIEDKDKEKLSKYLSLNESVNDEQNSFKINSFKNSTISGSINSLKNSVLFFSIPHDKGWEVKVDNKICKFYKVNIGFIGIPLNKGFHKIELTFFPPGLKAGFLISSLTLLILFVIIGIKKIFF